MKVTLTLIKADIGSVGGHCRPSEPLMRSVMGHVLEHGEKLLDDWDITHTGDDIAILMVHRLGEGNADVHHLAWDAFVEGANTAKQQGLCGAGQDLLKDAFAGDVKGLGPAVAEMEFQRRLNEPFLAFAADKAEPGAYNLPLYLAFAAPVNCAGLVLSPAVGEGFTFTIMDVSYTECDRVIELSAPDDLSEIATLLRDSGRYVIEKIVSRASGDIAAVVSTTRLRNIARAYTGKDDPIMIVRTQGNFPATGTVLRPFAIGPYVAELMRGSHHDPLMPVPINSGTSFLDGSGVVSALGFCVSAKGKLTEAADMFAQAGWDHVRDRIAAKAIDICRDQVSAEAMLPVMQEEPGGMVDRLNRLDGQFTERRRSQRMAFQEALAH